MSTTPDSEFPLNAAASATPSPAKQPVPLLVQPPMAAAATVNADTTPKLASGDTAHAADHATAVIEPHLQGNMNRSASHSEVQGSPAAQPQASSFQHPTSVAPETRAPRGKSGIWVAGIAIGAVLGGVVGGGTAALVHNNNTPAQVSPSQGSSITLNNTDSVSAVSAVAAVATPSVVTLQVSSPEGSGSGSGVIYSEDGYIITNSHVATLSGATATPDIRVRLSDGTMLDAELIGTDPYADIAVVKVDGKDLPAITVADSSLLNVGQTAIAIGAPLNLSNTVTGGIVSALNRGISVASSAVPEATEPDSPATEDQSDGSFPWDFRFELPQEQEQNQQQTVQVNSRVSIPVLQTDASINPGNSGGALLNESAELIGINVALAANGAATGTAGSDGLGFAIPSNLATRVADALIEGEQPSHGMLGVSVVESTQDSDEDALREGALIADMPEGSAAAAAGLRVGDVITAIDGVSVNSSTSASALIRYHEGGSTVEITYSRGGNLATIEVKLDTLTW